MFNDWILSTNSPKSERRFSALVYRDGPRRGGIVRRQYELWRSAQDPPLPLRCDNPVCEFYTAPLLWNDNELSLILDHRNGVNTDNRPRNLRLLCPNCESQLSETRGGANRGRVKKSGGGFAIVDKTGAHSYYLPAESGWLVLEESDGSLASDPE